MEELHKNYVLIGFQRSGTAWLGLHFREYYKDNYLGEYFSNSTEKDYTEKMLFLKNERNENREYYIKWMVSQIQNCPIWWNNFYKDYEKIKLLNKNVWRMFLSNSYQNSIDWKYEPFKREKKLKKFTISFNEITTFVKNYVDYLKFDNYDTLFDYDEITDEYVSNYLGNTNVKYRKRFVHNYEDYLQQDVDLTKEFFINELKKYGINYLQNDKIEL